jgi:hypothetical protein
MQNLLDPITVDLLFTVLSTGAVLIAATATLLALPWTEAQLTATETAAGHLLQFQAAPMRIRSTR